MIELSDWILCDRDIVIQSHNFYDLVSQADREGRYQLYELEKRRAWNASQEMFKISQNCQLKGHCVINRVFEGYCFLNWQMI